MSKRQNLLGVWQQIPVANRTVEVNTKTGFSLTAGSYAVRASSTQSSTIALAANTETTDTATISSVTTTRAVIEDNGSMNDADTTVNAPMWGRLTLTNATTITATRTASTSTNLTMGFFVMELF